MASIPASYRYQTVSGEETYRTVVSSFADGVEQSAPDGINNALQSWNVTFIDMTQAEAIALRDIIRSAKGSEIVYWIPPLETQVLKWKIRSHTVNLKNGNIFSIACTFKQVF